MPPRRRRARAELTGSAGVAEAVVRAERPRDPGPFPGDQMACKYPARKRGCGKRALVLLVRGRNELRAGIGST